MTTSLLERHPWLWTVMGALLGVAVYTTVFESSSVGTTTPCQHVKESGVLLAHLTAQPSKRHIQQPPSNTELKASKPFFQEMEDIHEKTYFMPCGKRCHPTLRSMRSLGWEKANEIEHGRMVFTTKRLEESQEMALQSWQRYSHLPHTSFVHKDEFLDGMAAYKEKHGTGPLQFLPQTYRLYNDKEQASLERILPKKAGNVPWVVQRDRKGSMKSQFANSGKEAKELVEQLNLKDPSVNRILQKYICDQMTWNGQEFLVRVFWFVASLDPLIVLYQDGYARIGYDRGNSALLKADDENASFDEFEAFINHEANSRQWRRNRKLDLDPIDHVRNQFKDSIATVVDAFRDVLKPPASGPEDAFSVFATDFIVDKELDVWWVEAYHHQLTNGDFKSFLLEDYYFLLDKNHELWYGMGLTLEEVWSKQKRNANILPLQTTGKWELIVAGDKWKYEYNQERTNKKKNKSCKVWTNMKESYRAVVREEEEHSTSEGETPMRTTYDDDGLDDIPSSIE